MDKELVNLIASSDLGYIAFLGKLVDACWEIKHQTIRWYALNACDPDSCYQTVDCPILTSKEEYIPSCTTRCTKTMYLICRYIRNKNEQRNSSCSS